MKPAIEQLNLAIPLARDKVSVERIERRKQFFYQVDRALKG
jgi:hypothetical protein